AVAELGACDGMQVHRSWWVARTAIGALDRAAGRSVLRLRDGRAVPVSRGNEKAVRAWYDAEAT
ncbi:MAG: LytTR family DNA-binding domain-containing protein, partial [Pseudomonadota bacterium]